MPTPTHDISTHPPRAGRDVETALNLRNTSISTHPPRAGRDAPVADNAPQGTEFQPTRPVRGGTAAIAPRA